MNEPQARWESQIFIRQYFEKLLEAYKNQDDINSCDLLEVIHLEGSYGIILHLDHVLNTFDVNQFYQYITKQLLSMEYVVNSKTEHQISFQAAVRKRVSGVQLFGNIRMIKEIDEIRIIVTPYVDRQFEPAMDPEELIYLLFS